MNIKYLSMAVFFIFPIAAAAQDEERMTYKEYSKRLGSSEEQANYGKRLIKHSELHKLIGEAKSVPEPEEREVDPGIDWLPDSGTNDQENQDKEKSKDESRAVGKKTKENTTGEPVPDVVVENNDQLEMQKEIERLKKELEKAQNQGKATAAVPSHEKSNRSAPNVAKKQPATKTQEPTRYIFIPPSLRTGQKKIQNTAKISAPEKQIVFGITIGTEIPLRLDSGASNVQPGYIKFIVDRDIVGDIKVLKRGSEIFVNPSAVLGSPRLFGAAVKGLTIGEHEEFSLRGSIFAEDRKAGLYATVVNDGRALARAKDAGVAAVGTGLIDMVPSGSLSTDAAKAAASKVIQENNSENNARNGQPNYILEAEPQIAFLQIEETF